MDLPVMPPVKPMLATPAASIPAGHMYEPKLDGFRSIIFRDGDEVVIGSRNEKPMTRYFPEMVAAVRASFPPRAVIDGKIVVAHLGANHLNFQALQHRRQALERALAGAQPPVHLAPLAHDADEAQRGCDTYEGAGLDGLIAKAPEMTYQSNKRVMTKITHTRAADCVVAGYRVHTSDPEAIGSLLLGLSDDQGTLANVGVVGALPMARRTQLFVEMQPLIADGQEHPWNRAAHEAGEPAPRKNEASRWNTGKDWSFAPLERPVDFDLAHVWGTR